MKKSIPVQVDSSTFPSGTPIWLSVTAHSFDVTSALLMLGSITVPYGFSSASPARFWGWVRYMNAISSSADLRITTPYVDLDPHQKSILSDDFGVAMSVQFFYDKLGGFKSIVDGRQFLLHSGHLMTSGTTKIHKPAKVGARKCPDFVILDNSGKWHVLECKGTQTSKSYRDTQLEKAVAQKNVIAVQEHIKGERLASGLYIGNDSDGTKSHLKIIDPDPDPLITINENNSVALIKTMRKLSLARAFGVSGFYNLSEEILLPPVSNNEEMKSFYRRYELERIKRDEGERLEEVKEVDFSKSQIFKHDSRDFVGREVVVEMPNAELRTERIRITQGIDADFSEFIKGINDINAEQIVEGSANYMSNDGIEIENDSRTISISDSRYFVSKLEFI